MPRKGEGKLLGNSWDPLFAAEAEAEFQACRPRQQKAHIFTDPEPWVSVWKVQVGMHAMPFPFQIPLGGKRLLDLVVSDSKMYR